MAQAELNRRHSTVSTSGLEIKTILTYPVPTGASMVVQCVAVGRETTSQDVMVKAIMLIFKNTGGTLTQVGVTETITSQEDASMVGCNCAVVIDGTSIEVDVTGDTGLNINWLVDLQLWIN